MLRMIIINLSGIVNNKKQQIINRKIAKEKEKQVDIKKEAKNEFMIATAMIMAGV